MNDQLARAQADLQHPEWEVRRRAVRHLAALGSAAGPLLAGAMSDASADVRRDAADALAQLADPGTVEALVAGAADRSPGVRAAVAAALGRIGGPPSVAPLMDLAADPDGHVARCAEIALASLDCGLDLLAHRLLERHDGPGIAEAIRGLAHIDRAETCAALARFVTDPDDGIRLTVAQSLSSLEHPHAAPLLLQLMEDGSAEVRSAAAGAMASVYSGVRIVALTRALKSARAETRREASQALSWMDGVDTLVRATLADPVVPLVAKAEAVHALRNWIPDRSAANTYVCGRMVERAVAHLVSLDALLRGLSRDADPEVAEGAAAVLQYLECLRPAGEPNLPDPGLLLRPASAPADIAPDKLLRPGEKPGDA